MRILLDSCVPTLLAPHIRGHNVASARERGWSDLKDHQLLDAMTGEFDVLLTVDKSIPFQQVLAGRPFAIIVLRAKSNRVEHLARLAPKVLRTLKTIQNGEVREVGD